MNRGTDLAEHDRQHRHRHLCGDPHRQNPVVVGAVDWSNLAVAGAFVVGAVVATIAYLRLTRHMMTMFVRRPRGDDDDVTPP
jgi:hypothetical protein